MCGLTKRTRLGVFFSVREVGSMADISNFSTLKLNTPAFYSTSLDEPHSFLKRTSNI